MTRVLACGLYRATEERLRQPGRAESPATVLQALDSVQLNRLRIKPTQPTRLILTEPSDPHRTYVAALDCVPVLAATTVQPAAKGTQARLESRIHLRPNGWKTVAPNVGYNPERLPCSRDRSGSWGRPLPTLSFNAEGPCIRECLPATVPW